MNTFERRPTPASYPLLPPYSVSLHRTALQLSQLAVHDPFTRSASCTPKHKKEERHSSGAQKLLAS